MKQYGQWFEERLRRELHCQFCETTWSRTSDEEDMVDATVWKIGMHVLPIPIEFQFTLQIDHYLKIKRFLETRGARDTASVYAEFIVNHRRVGAHKHAAAVMTLAQAISAMGDAARGLVGGLRINGDGIHKTFEIGSRLQELRGRVNPARTTHLRVSGAITGSKGVRLRLCGPDDREYSARLADVVDAQLYRELRSEQGRMSQGDFIVVSFIPEGGRARGVVRAGRGRMELPKAARRDVTSRLFLS